MPSFIVKLDQNKCIGCGSCAAVCPENFELQDSGKAHPLHEKIEELGCSQVAAESCPVQAINVEPAE